MCDGRGQARARPPKSRFGRVSFPFINSSRNRWYLARNAQHWKIWKSGILGILKSYVWKLSFFFINYSQNRWCLAQNTQKLENSKICSCLLMIARVQPVLAHTCTWMAVPEPVLPPQNPDLGGCPFPSWILLKIGDIWFEMPQIEKFGNLEFWGS